MIDLRPLSSDHHPSDRELDARARAGLTRSRDRRRAQDARRRAAATVALAAGVAGLAAYIAATVTL